MTVSAIRYKAKVCFTRRGKGGLFQYKVHYIGFNKRYDAWLKEEELTKRYI